MSKGVCFPTCVSVNGVFGNFSPSADCKQTLRDGDICKIELGAHIDGFVAMLGETIVCGTANSDNEAAARVVQAASASSSRSSASLPQASFAARAVVAAHAALHVLRPGVKVRCRRRAVPARLIAATCPGAQNTQLTHVVHDVADTFGVKPVRRRFVVVGSHSVSLRKQIKKLVSYQVKRFVFFSLAALVPTSQTFVRAATCSTVDDRSSWPTQSPATICSIAGANAVACKSIVIDTRVCAASLSLIRAKRIASVRRRRRRDVLSQRCVQTCE